MTILMRHGVIAVALLCAAQARGSDVLIPGKIGIVKSGKLAKFVSKAPAGAPFTLPAAGGPDDPALNGATLRFLDTDPTLANGGDSSFDLPAGAWKKLGKPPGAKGYRYKGAGTPADPCKVVILKGTVVKAVCKSTPFPMSTPFVDGDLGVRLVVGTGLQYCAEFGGREVKDDAVVFKRKDAGAPSGCWLSAFGDWVLVRQDDCTGTDIGSCTVGPLPDDSRCGASSAAVTAVCWDDALPHSSGDQCEGSGQFCTYKTTAAANCSGGSNPGYLYECVRQ
jgi:hypothetical protein